MRQPICFALASLLALLMGVGPVRAKNAGRSSSPSLSLVRIPAGSYQPAYASERDANRVAVSSFSLMTRPVTNAEFLVFVRSHPEYRRDRIAAVFADSSYLSHWAEPTRLGKAARPAQPVTRVSWFAAKAFCESRGLRLPLEREWELAAAASETERDGRSDPAYRERVLGWYSRPSVDLPDVPHNPPNVYGVRDLHTAVWEWVLDFGETMIATDSRGQGSSLQVCGSGARIAGDGMDYAAFMRAAMRSSLQASYTGSHLGFRCAADLSQKKEGP
jgi:formylglycine-generating enzyme required for sulfatase activity